MVLTGFLVCAEIKGTLPFSASRQLAVRSNPRKPWGIFIGFAVSQHHIRLAVAITETFAGSGEGVGVDQKSFRTSYSSASGLKRYSLEQNSHVTLISPFSIMSLRSASEKFRSMVSTFSAEHVQWRTSGEAG